MLKAWFPARFPELTPLAPRVRLFVKKRGDRRTSSSTAGSIGEGLFFGAMLLVGLFGLAAGMLWLLVPEWRANQQFVRHTCRVLDKRIARQQNGEVPLYRPEVQIEYRVGQQSFRIWTYDVATARDLASSYWASREEAEAALRRFVVERQQPRAYACWYDPANPEIAVLVRGYRWWIWPVLFVPLSLMAIGAGGLLLAWLHWGKSVERRAALAQKVQESELLGGNGRGGRAYPYVPQMAGITDSPGTHLRFRLPIEVSPAWSLFFVFAACVLWNGIVGVFAAVAVGGHLKGDPDWLLTLFLVPFALVGLLLVAVLIRQFLVTTGVGPTLVEISEHPLRPGASYRLFVSQAGRLRINRLEVSLVCEEEATFTCGTDRRTENREVFSQRLLSRERFEVFRGMPFEAELEFTVPAAAMHSFKAEHNSICWKVVVSADVAGWPDYRRSFPVVVLPANGDGRG